tara:strand:- start:18012 stop:18563 length:552 start_codon:yes stop_codon:yes gene_type:complete
MFNYRLKIKTFGGDPYDTGDKTISDTKYEKYIVNSNNVRSGNYHSCEVNRSNYGLHHNLDDRAIFKQIQKTVRVSSSEYIMNKSSLNVGEERKGIITGSWNQSSDRIQAAIAKAVVPTRGNSTARSITRLRPGSLSPGGTGVDVKHNSYARYLARLKGRKVLRQDANINNQTKKHNIVASCSC